MIPNSCGHTVSSQTIARRVSGELRAVAAQIQNVEAALEMILTRLEPDLRRETISDLQQLDLVSQSVCALADYLATNSVEMCATDGIDTRAALRAVTLREISRRLAGQVGDRSDATHPLLF